MLYVYIDTVPVHDLPHSNVELVMMKADAERCNPFVRKRLFKYIRGLIIVTFLPKFLQGWIWPRFAVSVVKDFTVTHYCA